MPAKKKSEPEVARSATSDDVPKSATPERIKVGDWVMLGHRFWDQAHLVARPRGKEKVVTACGLEYAPDFTGRPLGARCKRCTVLHSEVVKPKVVKE